MWARPLSTFWGADGANLVCYCVWLAATSLPAHIMPRHRYSGLVYCSPAMHVFDWSPSITYCPTCTVTTLLTETPTSRIWYVLKHRVPRATLLLTRMMILPGLHLINITWLAILDDVTGPFTAVMLLLNRIYSQDQSNEYRYLLQSN